MAEVKGISEDTAKPASESRKVPGISHRDLSRAGLLRTLFRALEEKAIRYCVLHSYEGLPDELPSDLDLVVHPEDVTRLPFVFLALREQGYRPVQCLNYAIKGYYFVFFWPEGRVLKSVAIDFICEHRQSGLILASGESLLVGRRRQESIWVADPSTEFAYLLAKKILKGAVPARQVQRLKLLVGVLGRIPAQMVAGVLFGKKWAVPVVEACAKGSIATLLRKLRFRLLLRTNAIDPLNTVRYLLVDAVRLMRRCLWPTGLFVVVLGPDGVGKSTLIDCLTQSAGSAFRRHRMFHWRPGLLWRRQSIGLVLDPHGQSLRSPWSSAVKLLALMLDYWLGYLLVVRPFLARSGLVLFDRYFHDLLVDPIRYRYGGPQWLPRVLVRLLPQPDLMLILDAPEHLILSRKQEVDREEVVRQLLAYIKVAESFPQAFVLDASRPLSEVGEQAARETVSFLERRFQHRYSFWLHSQENQDRKSAGKRDYRNSEENVVQKALDLLSGRHPDQNAPSNGNSPSLTSTGASPANGNSCSLPMETRSSGSELGARSFAVLPSRRAPRWLIPLGDEQLSLRGLEVWLPFSRSGRLAKRAFSLLTKMGLLEHTSGKAHVWPCGDLPIERFISEVTGAQEPVLALSLGTPGPFRKLTIRVMHRKGECLGYIKLPLTEAATIRVRHEAEMLTQLWKHSDLRPFLPLLLHAGPWADTYLLFQSSGPDAQGPIRFGTLHHLFLKTLWEVRHSQKAGHQVLHEVATRWQNSAHRMSSPWRDLGSRGLSEASRALAGSTIPCGLAHGDFAPWNTRTGNGRLFVFDWESAAWDVPQLWDFFHFRTQVASLLHRVGRSMSSVEPTSHSMDPSHEVALHMLYTLKSVSNLIEEGTPERSSALRYRRRLLEGIVAAPQSTRRSANVL